MHQEIAAVQVVEKRWVVVLGGFLLSLVGGMSYAWGSFVVPLVEDWGWSVAEATLPLTVLIIVFAIAMIPAGWLQDRIGPSKVAKAGTLLFFVGYGLAALLRYVPHPAWLFFTYGGIVGSACGLTYACIAPTARKWYADRPGFAVSTAVMGFGLAAVIFAPLKKVMLDVWGVDGTLIAIGVFVTVVASIGAKLLRNPPVDWEPPQPAVSSTHPAQVAVAVEDVAPRDFVKKPVFFLLWIALASVIGGGLTAIGLLTAYGELQLKLSPAQAAISISLYALVNGLGRPAAGWFADRVGTVRVMIIVYTVQATVFLALPWVATTQLRLLACALLLGAGYAVTFALFPVVVAAGFGTKYLGMNYGLVFSAFGFGAITGLMGSWLLDRTGSFTPAFLLAGGSTIVGLGLLIYLRRRLGVA